MRITIDKDMFEMVRGQEKQFLYTSATVRCVSLFEYEFFHMQHLCLKRV